MDIVRGILRVKAVVRKYDISTGLYNSESYIRYDIYKMDLDFTTCYILCNNVLWYVLL